MYVLEEGSVQTIVAKKKKRKKKNYTPNMYYERGSIHTIVAGKKKKIRLAVSLLFVT